MVQVDEGSFFGHGFELPDCIDREWMGDFS